MLWYILNFQSLVSRAQSSRFSGSLSDNPGEACACEKYKDWLAHNTRPN